MACSNITEIAPDSLLRKASMVISKPFISQHVNKRKSARHAITQPLFLQMSLLLVDCAYVNGSFMLCTAFEEQDMHRFRIFFETTPFCHPIRILPVIKRLRNLGRIKLIAKSLSIYTKICLRPKHKTFWRSWRKFSSTIFIANILLKLKIKKLLRKISSKNLTAGV